MNRREWFLAGYLVLVGLVALLSGCAVCRPDCRGMNHEDCMDLVKTCQQVNAREVPWEYGAGKRTD